MQTGTEEYDAVPLAFSFGLITQYIVGKRQGTRGCMQPRRAVTDLSTAMMASTTPTSNPMRQSTPALSFERVREHSTVRGRSHRKGGRHPHTPTTSPTSTMTGTGKPQSDTRYKMVSHTLLLQH
jgi:hypothetical protein